MITNVITPTDGICIVIQFDNEPLDDGIIKHFGTLDVAIFELILY
jgi:hypothetical protein